MNEPPKTLFELLELQQFREKTSLYTGDWKISSLKAFIDGYLYASWVKIADMKTGQHLEIFMIGLPIILDGGRRPWDGRTSS
jgi:hypothetical protein